MKAFEKLMSEHVELTYADIAELRRLCEEANRLKRDCEQQDAAVELMRGGPVMFRTKDGLECFYNRSAFTPGHLMPMVRRRLLADALPGKRNEAVESVVIEERVYQFKQFEGHPRGHGRYAVYEEV